MSSPGAAIDALRLEAIIAGLADEATTVEEAEALIAQLDGQEARTALPLFARLRDTRDPAELHAVSQLLAGWSGRPVARALLPALQAMLEEAGVADLNRLTAAGLVERLGEPVDYPALMARLEDLSMVARDTAARALEAATSAAAMAAVLDRLARMPVEQVLAFVDDLARLGDSRAAGVLAALSHAAQPDVAVSAVAAIDHLGLVAAAPALRRVASFHHDPGLRSQAGLTVERLAQLEPGPADATGPQPLASIEAFSGSEGEGGTRLILLAEASRKRPAASDLATFLIDQASGLRQHVGIEQVGSAERSRLFEAFAEAGRALEPVEPGTAAALLEAATRQRLAMGLGDSVAHIAWLERLPVADLD